MKKAIFSLLLLLVGTAMTAQVTPNQLKTHLKRVEESRRTGKVLYSLDTIFNAGDPYCLMYETTKTMFSVTEYSVRTLQDNREVIVVLWDEYTPRGQQNAVGYWTFNFLETGQKAEIQISLETHFVAKQLVKNNVMALDGLIYEGVNRMVQIHGTKISEERTRIQQQPVVVVQPPVVINNGGNPNVRPPTQLPAPRPRGRNAGNVTVSGTELRLNGTKIGTVTEKSEAERGTIVKYIYIYDLNGNLVADAVCEGITAHTWDVQTYYDRRHYNVVSSIGQDAKDVAKNIVENGYL